MICSRCWLYTHATPPPSPSLVDRHGPDGWDYAALCWWGARPEQLAPGVGGCGRTRRQVRRLWHRRGVELAREQRRAGRLERVG